MTAVDADVRPHPAKFSPKVLDVIEGVVRRSARARNGRMLRGLDPFAGVGGVYVLCERIPQLDLQGIEIEPEWAWANPRTIIGDATQLFPHWTRRFDFVITSPCYGNRMADCHDAKDDSRRITYRHSLGRMPTPGSTATMQWGGVYREMHRRAWREAHRVLRREGLAIVNVSDHIRGGVRQHVADWHRDALIATGLRLVDDIEVATPRMGFGENRDARVEAERVLVLRKP